MIWLSHSTLESMKVVNRVTGRSFGTLGIPSQLPRFPTFPHPRFEPTALDTDLPVTQVVQFDGPNQLCDSQITWQVQSPMKLLWFNTYQYFERALSYHMQISFLKNGMIWLSHGIFESMRTVNRVTARSFRAHGIPRQTPSNPRVPSNVGARRRSACHTGGSIRWIELAVWQPDHLTGAITDGIVTVRCLSKYFERP